MKFSAALVLAAVMTAGHCLPLNDGSLTPAESVKLTKALHQYVLSQLPKAGTWRLPDKSQEFYIPEIDTDVAFEGKSGEGYSSGWSLNDFKYDPTTASTRFSLSASDIGETYEYSMEGTLFGHNVYGEGVIRFDIIGYGYEVSDLRFEEMDESLQISVLDLSVVLDDVKIKIEGLEVETISVEDLEKKLEKFVMEQFNERKVEIDKNLALLKDKLNAKLYGHSVEEVIQWLRANTKRGAYKSRFIEKLFVPRFVMSEECIPQNTSKKGSVRI